MSVTTCVVSLICELCTHDEDVIIAVDKGAKFSVVEVRSFYLEAYLIYANIFNSIFFPMCWFCANVIAISRLIQQPTTLI